MQFPILPAGISVGLGAADGLLASRDAKNNGGVTPPLSKSKTLYLQGGGLVLGLVGEFMRWHPDITESLMFTSAALFSREFAFRAAQGTGTGSLVAQGYRASVPTGRITAAPLDMSGYGGYVQPAGAAGYGVRQSASSVG